SLVGRAYPIFCTVTRRVSPLASTSSTRRTKFRSADHRCNKHLLLSPEIEYFACARSNTTELSSITTALLLSERNPSNASANACKVIARVFQNGRADVCDG